MSGGFSLDDDGILPELVPIVQDDHAELTSDQLDSLVNTRCDPDVLSHNLLSVIVSDRIPHKIINPSPSNHSSASSYPLVDTLTSMVEWAAFLSALWRTDDPDATYEPSRSNVETADFLPYLRRINSEYNKYQNAIVRQSERHGKGIDAAAERAAFRASNMSGAGLNNFSNSSEMEELVLLTRPKAKDMMEAEKHLELTLATVPRMFFESEYDFTNPDTFLAVTEMPGMVQSIVRESLPIKLSSYLDMVELSLCKQVSVRAGAFYRAQASLRDSHGRVKVVASKIKSLRSHFKAIKENDVMKPLNLIRLQRKVENLNKVKEVMELVVEVQATKEVIVGLLNVSEFHSALDVVENTRFIVNTKLIRIRGLASYRRELEDYENLIVRTMASRFEVAAIGYHPDDTSGEEHLNNQLKPLVSGLLRTRKLEYVLMEHKKRMQAEIMNVGKTVVRTYLSPSYDNNDNTNSSNAGGGGGGGGSSSSGSTGSGSTGSGSTGSGSNNNSGSSSSSYSNKRKDNYSSDDEDENRNYDDEQDWKVASTTLKELNSTQFLKFLELLFEHFLIVVVQSTTVHKVTMTILDLSVVQMEETVSQNKNENKDNEKDDNSEIIDNNGNKDLEDQFENDKRDKRRLSMKGVTSTTVITQEEQLDLQASSLEIITATCRKAQKSVAGVLSKRKKKHTLMSIAQMKQLWDTCIRFAKKCEKKSGDRMVRIFSPLLLFLMLTKRGTPPP